MNSISTRRILTITVSSLVLSANAFAQDFSHILKSIEENSTKLVAARMRADAEKADSRVGTALPDPEIGVSYLWGNGDIGNRVDVSATQAFDFPTVMMQKKRLAKEQRRVADLKLLDERQALLLSAKKLCIEVVYCNAIMDHLNEDLEETHAMAEAYQKLYEKGEATIIDRNKAHQAVLFFEAEYREFHTMRNNLLAELKCLNGGKEVMIEDTAFVHTPLSNNFEEWIAQNIGSHPSLQLAEGQVALEASALKLAKKEWAPQISLGYTSEFEKVDHYQGVAVGVAVPLWSGKRKINAAKAHLAAAQIEQKDTYNHLETQLRTIYADALQLQETYIMYSKHLEGCDNTALLIKNLNAGQITLLTYLQERQYVHEMHEKLLIAERDLELRKAELTFYE